MVSVEEERSLTDFVIKLERSFTRKMVLNISNSIKVQLTKETLNAYVVNNVDCRAYFYKIINDSLYEHNLFSDFIQY